MKKILGLDLGTNSIGWAVVSTNSEGKPQKIEGMGSRIIPMGSDKSDYEKGATITKMPTEDKNVLFVVCRKDINLDEISCCMLFMNLECFPIFFSLKMDIFQKRTNFKSWNYYQ